MSHYSGLRQVPTFSSRVSLPHAHHNSATMFIVILVLLSYLPSTLPYKDFSSNTPYEYSRGDITKVQWSDQLVPTRFYLIARHGSRHLLAQYVISMDKFLDKILLEDEGIKRLPWLRTWKRPLYFQDLHLVPQGMLEHYHLAQRYKKKFPAFFPPYYPTRYHIRSTHILRTSQSAASFLFGIFEGMGPLNQFSLPTNLSTNGFQPVGLEIESADEDELLRFMDNCPAYTNCPMTKNSKLETTKLQKSEKYKKLILDPISERTGFSLTVEDAEGLYDLCNFEHVSPTESNNSSFCDLIPRSAFALLDYSRDFYGYYKSSYPNKLGYELSCVILEDVLREFESEESATALRFAHSETIVPLITLLGINKDQDIIYTWDKDRFWNRTTKLSELDPFATNMGFVVFKNSSSGQDIIKIYLNEREVKITACVSSEEGCTRDELLDIVRGTLGQCDRSAMCFGTNTTNDDVIISTVDDVIVSTRDNENDNVQPMNESTSLTSQCISEKNVDLAVAARLADENKVLLDFNLFVIMTGLSGLCIVLMGLVAFNCKKIISDDVDSGYQKMPFLDS